MRIRMRTLFLVIAIFQHYSELNAAEPESGSSLVERRKRGRPRGSRANQQKFRDADPNDGPPDRLVHYGQIEIRVWLQGPLVRKAIFYENYIPQGQYFKYNNFLIRTFRREDVTLVAYISQWERLIGVRPRDQTGRRHDLEPTPSEWFINHGSTHFKIQVRNSVPTAMSLMPRNSHEPAASLVKEETVAGITFKMFRDNRDMRITGAELVSFVRIAP